MAVVTAQETSHDPESKSIPAERVSRDWFSEWRDFAVNPTSFFAQVSSTFLAKLLISAIAVLTTALVARLLGPAGRGEYAAAMALATIGVQVTNLGLHASNTYTVASRPALLPKILGNTLAVVGTAGLFGVLLLRAFFWMVPSAQPVTGSLLYLCLLWVPVGLAFLLLQSLLLGLSEIRSYNAIEISTRTLVLGAIAVLGWIGVRSPEAFFFATVVCFAAGALWMFRKTFIQADSTLAFSRELFNENLHYGFKAYLGALFAFVVLRIDLLMVKSMLGAAAAGYYSVSVTLGEMILMMPTVIGSLLFPKLSGMEDDNEKWKLAKRVFFMTGGVMPVVIGVTALLARPLIVILFGSDFLPAIPAFLWLLPGLLVLSINLLIMNYLASMNMPWVTVYAPFVSAVMNCTLNLWLIPKYGIVGASISSSICYTVMLSLALLYVIQHRKDPGPGSSD